MRRKNIISNCCNGFASVEFEEFHERERSDECLWPGAWAEGGQSTAHAAFARRGRSTITLHQSSTKNPGVHLFRLHIPPHRICLANCSRSRNSGLNALGGHEKLTRLGLNTSGDSELQFQIFRSDNGLLWHHACRRCDERISVRQSDSHSVTQSLGLLVTERGPYNCTQVYLVAQTDNKNIPVKQSGSQTTANIIQQTVTTLPRLVLGLCAGEAVWC
eukprot:3440016-Amphidinium_carterae.1